VNANAPWFRTGMIIATGICYKLSYIGGLTRDGERRSATHGGQRVGWFDLRNNLLIKPRLSNENWMVLCAAIAHPRIWTPQVKGVLMALRYLFRKAPELLLNSRQADIYKKRSFSGLLYLFVNNLRQTAGDNSGGPKLGIEPFEEAEIKDQGPLYRLNNKVEETPEGPKRNRRVGALPAAGDYGGLSRHWGLSSGRNNPARLHRDFRMGCGGVGVSGMIEMEATYKEVRFYD
jgi:hypothetical protein